MKKIIILLSLSLCSVMAWGTDDQFVGGSEWFTCIVKEKRSIISKIFKKPNNIFCVEKTTNNLIRIDITEETIDFILLGYKGYVKVNCIPDTLQTGRHCHNISLQDLQEQQSDYQE